MNLRLMFVVWFSTDLCVHIHISMFFVLFFCIFFLGMESMPAVNKNRIWRLLTLHRTGPITTSGHSWERCTCPTVFSMTKGEPHLGYTLPFGPFFFLLVFGTERHHSCRLPLFQVLNLLVHLQVHFTGQHGQHLSKHVPPDSRQQRGETIQAGLPPGEWRGRAKLSCLI